jgi:hypothetical protein
MDETKHTPKPGPGHESADINIWKVGKLLLALVGIMVLALGVVFGLFKFLQSEQDTSQANKVEPRKIFPQPQLQQTPVIDLQTVRAEEEQYLNSYAWVDQKKGLVKVPIDLAIDVLARQGIPSRAKGGVQSAASGISVPTESGLGVIPTLHGDIVPQGNAPPPAAELKSVVGPNKGQPEQVNTKEVQKK